MAIFNTGEQVLFNSASGETGATETIHPRNRAEPAIVYCDLGAGDTIVIEGKFTLGVAWAVLATFAAADNQIQAIWLPPNVRGRRTVIGGAQSKIYIEVKGPSA